MVNLMLQKLQKLAVVGALTLASATSVSAGLFCNLQCCQQPRDWYSPACEPAWGYHQTCWRKFPPVEPCSGWGDYCAACDTNGGGGIAPGAYQDGGYGMDTHQQAIPLQPISPQVLQAPPAVINQPSYHAAPTQNYGGQNYAAPMQATPSYGGQGYGAGADSGPSYNYNASPNYGTPLNIEPSQPEGGAGDLPPQPQVEPRLPDSSRLMNIPGNYQQTNRYAPRAGAEQISYGRWQPVEGVQPVNSNAPAPQSIATPQPGQQVPVRGVSFNGVRPTNGTQRPVVKRSLLSRLLPGGK